MAKKIFIVMALALISWMIHFIYLHDSLTDIILLIVLTIPVWKFAAWVYSKME